MLSPYGNLAFLWTGDLCSKSELLILAKYDDDVIHVEGVVKGVKVCVDLWGYFRWHRDGHDFALKFVESSDIDGPDLEMMQGCHGFAVPGNWNELYSVCCRIWCISFLQLSLVCCLCWSVKAVFPFLLTSLRVPPATVLDCFSLLFILHL